MTFALSCTNLAALTDPQGSDLNITTAKIAAAQPAMADAKAIIARAEQIKHDGLR